MDLAPSVAGLGDLVEIGRGGFGVVYRAMEPALGRPVAVKILIGTPDELLNRRFERECRAMGKVAGHPHVVTVHRAGRTDAGQPFIVMELLEGGSMQDRLRRDGAVGSAEAVRIGIDIASALDTAHAAGVCHRDVKPDNLLLSAHGVVKLADFGMALIRGSAQTRPNVVGASLAHVAPEVLTGRRPDARADVYSLGSTLYELMRGRPAFARDGEDSLAPMLARIAQDVPPSLTHVGVPPAVCAVVERAMAKDPVNRPASAGELRQDLERVQASSALLAAHRTVVTAHRTGGAAHQTGGAVHRAGGGAHRTTSLDSGVLVAPTATPSRPPPRPAERSVLQRLPERGPGSDELAPPPPPRRSHKLAGLLSALSFVMIAAVIAGLATSEPLLAAPADATTLLRGRNASALLASAVTGNARLTDLDDYDQYVSHSEDHGTVTVGVPAAWSDVNTAGYVVAAERITDFFDSRQRSGAAVTVSTRGGVDPDQALDNAREADCADVQRVDYDGSALVGRADAWAGCGRDGTTAVVRLVAVPRRDSDLVVVASLRLREDRDLLAAQRVLGSIAVDSRAL